MAFRLISAIGGTVPFALGFAFREGDVPANVNLSSDFPELQVTRKNAWPDGSLKFAIVSGRAALQPNTPRTVTLRTGGSAPLGPNIGTADLKATGITSSITYGSYGTAAWNGSDWDVPFQNWVSGPEMSSWVFRKPIGSDAHLVAWLEVRCFRDGSVEVVPWIENGYLRVAGPGERSGAVTFTLAGSQRFSQSLTLLNHQRAVLVANSTLSYWIGGDPQLTIGHDSSYLKATRLVPNYRGSTSGSSQSLAALVSTHTPLAQGNFPNAIGSTGYHPSIGLLPQWDVLYLTSNADVRAWRASQINGYLGGRYGFHHRDETTNRAPRMSAHPNLVLGTGNGIADIGSSSTGSYTPAASGGTPPQFKSSHMPSFGYMPYLITGRWYFMDEVQLLASAMFLKQPDTVRGLTQFIINSASGANQVRGMAWTLRSLVHAANVTPDDDTSMRSEYVNSVNNNINRYHTYYLGNGDVGGHLQYANFGGGAGWVGSPWEDDFATQAFGFLADQKVHSAALQTKLNEFLTHKYQSVIGRLGPGTAGTYNFEHAAQYRLTMSPSTNPDWAGKTGPWYTGWGAIAAAWGVPANTGSRTLQGESGASPAAMATGYWGNLHPAIAYAVDHGAPGATAAYQRLTGADNYQPNQFDDTPEWGVVPRQ